MALVTWNPNDKSSNITLSNNNLTATNTSGNWQGARSTSSKTTGKWYFELKVETVGTNEVTIGIVDSTTVLTSNYPNIDKAYLYDCDGKKWNGGGTGFSTYGTAWVVNDIISILINLDDNNGQIEFWRNGVSQGVAFTNILTKFTPVYAYILQYGLNRHNTVNFGATSFTYQMPVGYSSYDDNQHNYVTKYLIKQNNDYYSLNQSLYKISNTFSSDLIPKYGSDNLAFLYQTFNTNNILMNNDGTIGSGKQFSCDLNDDIINVNNII